MRERPTVLLVAPGPDARAPLLAELEQAKLTALPFDSLEEAIPAVAEEPPLLAAVHFQPTAAENAPEWEMLHTYAQLNGVAVLLFGKGDFRTVRDAFAAGASDYLPLPLARGALEQRARRLLLLGEQPGGLTGDPAAKQAARHGKSVFIAAHDVVTRMRLESLLQESGYATRSVDHGRELLTALASGATPPAVCLVDTALPELEGMEGVRRIRSSPAWEQVPIAAVLGVGESGKGTGALEVLRQLGVRDFLETTDVGLEGVVPLVDELLAAQSARRLSPRMPLLAPGEFRVHGQPWEPGFVYNLSERGIFLRTLLPPERGATVEFRFPLMPGGRPLQGSAQVAWVQPFSRAQGSTHPPGVGLLFDGLRAGDQGEVAQLLGTAH